MEARINNYPSGIKHLFVVNPMAGKADGSAVVDGILATLEGRIDYEKYVTRSPGDATRYVRQRCAEAHEGVLRFYACGGDGTINEVLTGMMGARDVELSCLPIGSGNDFVKYYGSKEDFLDIERLVDGEVHSVDVAQVDCGEEEDFGRLYSINVVNFGFEAAVCEAMARLKRKPVIGGRHAYYSGIAVSLFGQRRHEVKVWSDGSLFYDGMVLLCTLSNGAYVGGSFKCGPRSKNDDGLLEVGLVKTMPLLKLLSIIGLYKKGTHLDDPRAEQLIRYVRAKELVIEAPKPLGLCVDGELHKCRRYQVRQLPGAVRFVAPRPKSN